jgi:ubiquinone biosynthesis protein COQ9
MKTWDYKIADGLEFVSQDEWNQTLIIRIDEVAYKTKFSELRNIVVPKQLMTIVSNLKDYSNGILKNKYTIIESELSKMNCLLIEGEQLYILNYPYIK